MEEIFKEIAVKIALGVELIAALLIGYGALEAVVSLFIPRPSTSGNRLQSEDRSFFALVFGCFWDWSLSWLPTSCAARLARPGRKLVNSVRSPRSAPF